MTDQKASGRERAIVRTLLMDILLPAVGFGLGVGFATGDYPVSMTTGLAISS
jgi:uroporphyrinogen-III decarboxylase